LRKEHWGALVAKLPTLSVDALAKARVACQHQLADQTLTCVCVVGGSHTVTLTVDRDAFVEEEVEE
jgi:hypothetical protein